MFKTVLELQDMRAIAIEKMTVLNEAAKTEKRKLTTEEDVEFRTLKTEIDTLANEIVLAEARASQTPKTEVTIPKTEKRSMKKFSLLRAIGNVVENRAHDEVILSVINDGKEEMRKSGQSPSGQIVIPSELRADIVAGGAAGTGIEVVAEQKMGILEPLRAALVLVQAGANFLTGLVGDVSIPVYGGTSALWKGEIAAAVDGAGAFSEVLLAPKRLTTTMKISKRFLLQDGVGAEAMLMQDIVNAISGKLEATIFGKEDISVDQPLGLFFTAPTIKGVASWANIVKLETNVATANANMSNLKYICSPAARGVLKTTAKTAGQAIYLMSDAGLVNGYPCLCTNHVAVGLQAGLDENGIAFGNWNDLVIAQWGGFDLTVDPYTAAGTGEIVLTINAYFDAKVRRAESFQFGSIK